ncbi:alpha/beta hydrolase family protein [Aquimarina agarilytica]|uniref:alpha/beta hydrolase family protein n=1 Tax=Aquimarina agarilytica TaxID=1087449 RepID=UPI0002899A4F|nr:alpha/beta fold hydrolase [Aquimarina agarilytica]
MTLTIHKNIPLVGKHKKAIVTDFIYKKSNTKLPVLIFCHGYKGFKDWGPWQLMLKSIANNDFFVVAFNFSHNGGTIEQPIDFPDLEAFGNDNFSKQQDDLQAVIDEITASNFKFNELVDTSNITLMGHSRGGGVVTIKASNESKVTKIITLAAIASYNDSLPAKEKIAQWRNEGVLYVKNGRTKQDMPLHYQLFEDYQANQSALDISAAAKKLTIPHLIIHGKQDPTVPYSKAELLHQWSQKSKLLPLDTDHVFNAKHPWLNDQMPPALTQVTQAILNFLK